MSENVSQNRLLEIIALAEKIESDEDEDEETANLSKTGMVLIKVENLIFQKLT